MGPLAPEDLLDDISDLAKLRGETEDMLVKAVRAARRKGVSWYKIGPALGVTRQAAEAKYKPKLANGKR